MLGWTWSLKHETFYYKWCTRYCNLKKMKIFYIMKDLTSLALIGSSYNYAQCLKGESILYKIEPLFEYYIDYPDIGNFIVYSVFLMVHPWGVNFILELLHISKSILSKFFIYVFKRKNWFWKPMLALEIKVWNWKASLHIPCQFIFILLTNNISCRLVTYFHYSHG